MSQSNKESDRHTKSIIQFVSKAMPIIITSSQKAWAFYKSLPEDYLQLIIGLIFCFFGGVFPVLFAAIEAAKHGGIHDVTTALRDLSDEAMKIIEASKKDDEKDEDKDGKKDVEQIDAKALLMRKTNLVLTKMNPEKVDKAITSIYRVWLSVVAVLSLKFAQTISLSISISKFLEKPTNHYVTPTLKRTVPGDYQKWVPVLMGWLTKSIGITIAWRIKAIITAVTSALTGALLATRALLKIARNHEITLNGLIPKEDKDTLIDEVASYAIAVMGMWFQFKIRFDIPFPLNILFWPMGMIEYLIKISITKA